MFVRFYKPSDQPEVKQQWGMSDKIYCNSITIEIIFIFNNRPILLKPTVKALLKFCLVGFSNNCYTFVIVSFKREVRTDAGVGLHAGVRCML